MGQSIPPDVDILIEQLKSPDPGERIQTVKDLAELDCRDEKVRLALENAARHDPDMDVRTEVRSSLAKLGFPVHSPEGEVPVEPVYTMPQVVRSPDSNGEIQSRAYTTSPFLSIWVKPRGTIRRIVDSDPTKYVLILAMLTGVSQSLDNASRRNAGDSMPLIAVLAICIIGGSIGGIISLYIGGALFRWSGSWFGGQATSEEVRAAIAWSSLPNIIISFPVWILMLLIYGQEMFTSSTPRMDANPILALIVSLPLLFATIIAGIWSLVLMVKCVGEVHRFSAWKALAAIILGPMVILVPIFCIIGTLVLLSK